MRFTDFDHFIEAWHRDDARAAHRKDYRELVLDYAVARRPRGRYLEAIFSPTDRCASVSRCRCLRGLLRRRASGARAARDRGRLTPDITRFVSARGVACETGGVAVRYADRGVVGARARRTGGAAPAGAICRRVRDRARRRDRVGATRGRGDVPPSIRGALDALQADRIRHGVRAVEDPPC